jgi:hypothetical protein
VAILFGATGPNITASGGDYSFEQALFAAELMLDDSAGPALILGADEGHDFFSPLLDASITPGTVLADGGGALCVDRDTQNAQCCISIPFYQRSNTKNIISALVDSLAASGGLSSYALILAGIPAAIAKDGEKQLQDFMVLSKLSVPVIEYRKLIGEFASASAVATALAASFLDSGIIPGALAGGSDIAITAETNKILVLGFGQYVTAMELIRP